MKVGLIGLGRMGQAIVHRLLKARHEVIAFDLDESVRTTVQKMGVSIVERPEDVVKDSRVVWIMVPAGDAVDNVIHQLLKNLGQGDIVIDGGNSKFSDSMRRAKELGDIGIHLLDCGTSGGLHGREIGFSLMIGGDKQAFEKAEHVFAAVAASQGYGYMGPSGTGHYVKMIHNGIEYALMQAYAQGFHLIKEGRFAHMNLEEISRVWMHGSIIRSWILELAHEIFQEDPELAKLSGEVEETGMGRWTVEEALEHGISVKLIDDALRARAWSQETGGNYATKIVAMLRNKFGGHAVKKIR